MEASPFLIVMAVSVAHYLFSVPLFVYRYKQMAFPVNGHSLPLVLIASTSVTAWAVYLTLNDSGVVPCASLIFVSFTCSILFGVSTLLRSWRTWFLYSFAGAKLSQSAEDKTMQQTRGSKAASVERAKIAWFTKYKHHFTDRRLTLYTVVGSLMWQIVLSVPWLALDDLTLITDPTLTVHGLCGRGYGISANIFNYWSIFVSVSLLLTIFKLRNVRDAYHLRNDCVISVGLFLTIALLGPLAPNIQVFRITVGFLLNVELFAVVTIKNILSYRATVKRHNALRRKKRRDRKRASSTSKSATVNIGSLRDVLGDPILLKQFNEHLQTEFSVENMLFYQRSKSYFRRCTQDDSGVVPWSMDERNREAALIYIHFVAHDADWEVNLNYEFFEGIQAEIFGSIRNFSVANFRETEQVDSLRPASTHIFEGACKSVFNLMNTDTLLRFKTKLARARADEAASAAAMTLARRCPPFPFGRIRTSSKSSDTADTAANDDLESHATAV